MSLVNIYNRKYADYAIGVQRYNGKPFNPFKTYLLLTVGTKFTATSDLSDILEAELPQKNGYARIPFRVGDPIKIQSVDQDTNIFKSYTTSNTNFLTQDQPIYFLNDSNDLNLPNTKIGLKTGVAYYALNPDSVSGEFQIAESPGGLAIDVLNGSNNFYVAKAGTWNTANNRYESAINVLLLTAGGIPPGLSFDSTVIVHATTSWGSYEIQSIDTGPDEFYTSFTHQIQENDLIYFTASAGGSLPTASGTSLVGRKVFKAKNISGKKFKISEDDNSTVALTSTGSGIIKVFSAAGFWEQAVRQDNDDANLPIIIPPNDTRQFTQQFTTSFL